MTDISKETTAAMVKVLGIRRLHGATDMIEALAARVEELQARAMIAEDREALWADRAKTADAEVARLREALAGLLAAYDRVPMTSTELAHVVDRARVALQEKPE
jgi:hypothetical protein